MRSKKLKKLTRLAFAASSSLFCFATALFGLIGLPIQATVSFVLCFAMAAMSTLVERHL